MLQVVISPHVYGPSISLARADFTGAVLYTRLSQTWGYLNREGYCARGQLGNCHRFPIAIGEFGSFLDARVPGDIAFTSMRLYAIDGLDGANGSLLVSVVA